jgi:YHS domain-containing protein
MVKMQAGKVWLTLLVVMGLVAAAAAQPPPTTSGGSGLALLNLDNTVALHGYDPMGYFLRHRAVKGNKRIFERIGGATYYFASRHSRYEFLRDAPSFQPQFGGYCATSMARGRVEDIDPHLFVIFEGRLYLFNNPESQAMFLQDPHRLIYEARQNYFRIATQQRRYH